jgi:hypothetical protein
MFKTIETILQEDIEGLKEANKQYGGSWIKRGGVGAFMMLARKWDRIEEKMNSSKSNSVIDIIEQDTRAEGIIDDIRDLRRYLMLVEAYNIGGSDYLNYLERISLSKEFCSNLMFDTLLGIWYTIESECKDCGWDIFKIKSSYKTEHLRSLLVQIEFLFSALGICPKHRDNK